MFLELWTLAKLYDMSDEARRRHEGAMPPKPPEPSQKCGIYGAAFEQEPEQESGDGHEGFSFSELLLVVCIIGILSAIALPFYSDFFLK